MVDSPHKKALQKTAVSKSRPDQMFTKLQILALELIL